MHVCIASYADSALDEMYVLCQPIQVQCWYWVQADFEHQVKLERQLNTDLQRQHEQLTQAKVGHPTHPSHGPALRIVLQRCFVNAFALLQPTVMLLQFVSYIKVENDQEKYTMRLGASIQQPSSRMQHDCALTLKTYIA